MKYFVSFILALETVLCFSFRGAGFNASIADLVASGRIYQGQTAVRMQIPYQVGLKFFYAGNDFALCGGVLISPKWILTAAHCGIDVKRIVVSLGSTLLMQPKMTLNVPKYKLIIHIEFDTKKKDNDIALINIPKVRLSKTIQVVRLPAIASSYSTYEGKSVFIAGWGKESSNAIHFSNKLKWASMRIISNTECGRTYGPIISESHMCALSEKLVNACEGDSGGPVISQSGGTLIGLISFNADRNCENGFPIVFTRITSFLQWIKDNTGVAY